MFEWKSTKDAKFVDMIPYLFRHKRTEEEMKFAESNRAVEIARENSDSVREINERLNR